MERPPSQAAVLGWFAFVLVAFAIGSAAGLVLMKDEDFAIGDSHAAEQVLAREFPTERAGELVLSRAAAAARARRARQRPSTISSRALLRAPAVAAIESPLDAGNGGQMSADGRSALVTFQITGDPDTAAGSRRPGAGRDGRGAAGAPDAAHREVGDAQRQRGDQHADRRRLPAGRVHLASRHARDPCARLRRARRRRHPAAARHHRGDGRRSG